MSDTELALFYGYLESGIPAVFQFFISALPLLFVLASGFFVAIFFLKIVRFVLNMATFTDRHSSDNI